MNSYPRHRLSRRNTAANNSNYAYQEIARLAKNPPKRLFGYNSRMDNREDVEGAIQTDEFVLRMTEAFTDAWISRSDEKRQKVLDALYAWAEADALTQTKPCAKNGSYLVAAVSGHSQTVRTHQTVRTIKPRKYT